ncbi:hypothetical protein [Polaribacter atrinae]|uniref:MalT-like TPR region domain-containing protein n=1 Tax=Polaribacter atrinae TaxID=1333662 RepID=A0A176TDB0_9FLAO|nr:hypothetical protein [Polaribacter atrinae]OAD45406.1 hypothetical protein LPB303_08425 [Polaribacter atrinae]
MSKNVTSANQQNDALFVLIKSLTKSEKRQFNLYVGRLGGNIDAKFFSLFKFLEKLKVYDEKVIIGSGIVSKQQLSNLKAHLYKQILISLRLNPAHKNVRIQIREQLDFATVLYQKGLYKQSLKLLEKAKHMALDTEEKNIAYEIVELEKVIETQYITRSLSNRANQLSIEAKELSQDNVIASKLSNLSLQLYSHLIQNGYVKNIEELEFVDKYFSDRMPKYDYQKLGFREKLWLYKAHLWHSFLVQDFLLSYKYAKKCVDLFDSPKLINTHPVFYLKSKNYLLEASFLVKKVSTFKRELSLFESEIDQKEIPMNTNTELLIFLYLYSNKLHFHFLEGSFEKGEYLVDIINNKIDKYKNRLDNHYIVLLYYKIACLYFGMGKNKLCIIYLQKIIKSKNIGSAEDLQCFARILNLIAHYECGLDYDLERQFVDTYKFLLKMENLQEVQKVFLTSIRDLSDVFPHEIRNEFKKIHAKLKKFENHPYEKRAFLYLDILSWLESKIQNKPIALIIKEKIKPISK